MAMFRRILFFSPGWPPGHPPNGIVSYIDNLRGPLGDLGFASRVLANEVSRPNADVSDLSAIASRRPLRAKLVDRAVRRLAPLSGPTLLTAREIRASLKQLRDSFPVDLMEMEESFGIAERVQASTDIPIVVRLHGPWFLNGPALGVREDEQFEWRVRSEGAAIGRARAVSAPSRDVLNSVRRHYRLALPNAEVIPNPGPVIPAEACWNRERAQPGAILFVGRFDRHKGGDLVIDAFREVAKHDPKAQLWFAGPDRGLASTAGPTVSLAGYIESQLRDGDLVRRVRVLGLQSQESIADLRRRAAVTVVASRYENLPMTVVEAFAFGTPLVASDVGGISEMICDGVNALGFRVGSANDMAAKILAVLSDPDLAQKLARGARADYEARFAPSVIAAKMAAFYGRVLAGQRTRNRVRWPLMSH
jgi:glycosyltransferase involved in cell wall biosynthesis